MTNEKVTNEKIMEFLKKMDATNYERFTLIDSVIGRRTVVMEVKIDSIDSLISSIEKEQKRMSEMLCEKVEVEKDQDSNLDLHIEKMTSDEILNAIKIMDNEERWKLLDILYDEYYNSSRTLKVNVEF
ncbi:hypothetical protein ACFVRR_21645 [Gottfriedia sp. NPDC057948]|uniref:hypothetical protein n=1 Tax=Gottfriedia sp. NPDC057948 TaxID=3346287 RepID=UPI0036D79F93